MTNNSDEQFLQSLYQDDLEQQDFPLQEVPESLNDKLYRISDAQVKPRRRWVPVAAAAASVLIMCTFALLASETFEQHQQRLQAQQDVKVALYYFNKANRKAAHSVQRELTEQLQNTTLQPVINTVVDVTSG